MKSAIMVKRFNLNRLLSERTMLVYFSLILFIIVAGIVKPVSLGLDNLKSVIQAASILGIVSLGQGIVMLSGGMDISIGNLMFFIIVYGGHFLSRYPEYFVGLCVLCLLVGALVGLINGIGVSKFKISPIIMTLATSSILYGLIYIFGGGRLGSAAPETLQQIGQGVFLGIVPYSVIIWIILAIFFTFLLSKTTFGRRIYATGNNPDAAFLSGIKVEGILVKSYIICDVLAALAGLIFLGYLGTPTLRFTDLYTMGSIEACVLGGIDFYSGIGNIVGTIAGSFFVRFMFTFLLMLSVPEAGRMIVEGVLILVIVAAYKLREK